jgi:putative CRISPR-associated protein (TIGR02619 family)
MLARGHVAPDAGLYFVHSATADGRNIAAILRAYYHARGHNPVEAVEVTDLQDEDSKRFRTKGLRNLVRALCRVVGERTAAACAINATGGYKAQIGVAVLLGQALGIDVYYMHERFSEIIAFPPLPVALDFEVWMRASGLLLDLERSPEPIPFRAYAQNADCTLAGLAFAARVNLDRVLLGTRFQAPFGQSPFAFQRGLAFEERLRANNYEAMLDLLRAELRDPLHPPRTESLRDKHSATRAGMVLRHRELQALLNLILKRHPNAPHLIDGAVLKASVGGLEAYFEADAVAARAGGEIRVAEVKSFPKVDERVDADKLGAALDQVAIYILLTREEVVRLGGDPLRWVSDLAPLITPRNVGMQPTLSVKEVGPRVARAEKLLASVPRVEDVVASVPAGLSFGPVADSKAEEPRRLAALHVLADRVGTAYKPGCLAACGNARFCRERAFCSGSPSLLGTSTARVLPGIISLDRAEELTRGVAPTAAESHAAALLATAGRLYDAAASPAQPVAAPPARRYA